MKNLLNPETMGELRSMQQKSYQHQSHTERPYCCKELAVEIRIMTQWMLMQAMAHRKNHQQ